MQPIFSREGKHMLVLHLLRQNGLSRIGFGSTGHAPLIPASVAIGGVAFGSIYRLATFMPKKRVVQPPPYKKSMCKGIRNSIRLRYRDAVAFDNTKLHVHRHSVFCHCFRLREQISFPFVVFFDTVISIILHPGSYWCSLGVGAVNACVMEAPYEKSTFEQRLIKTVFCVFVSFFHREAF